MDHLKLTDLAWGHAWTKNEQELGQNSRAYRREVASVDLFFEMSSYVTFLYSTRQILANTLCTRIYFTLRNGLQFSLRGRYGKFDILTEAWDISPFYVGLGIRWWTLTSAALDSPLFRKRYFSVLRTVQTGESVKPRLYVVSPFSVEHFTAKFRSRDSVFPPTIRRYRARSPSPPLFLSFQLQIFARVISFHERRVLCLVIVAIVVHKSDQLCRRSSHRFTVPDHIPCGRARLLCGRASYD